MLLNKAKWIIKMPKTLLLILSLVSPILHACANGQDIRYCDSSSGLNVNENGDYSSSYCTRHAVMDMQKFEGICMWHGGVAKITGRQQIICNDGSYSEISSLRHWHYDTNHGFLEPDSTPKANVSKDLSNYKSNDGTNVLIE